MEQKFEQKQVERERQAMVSTMQVALSALLELPIEQLADRVRTEMMENAAIEEDDGHGADDIASSSADGDTAEPWEKGGDLPDLGDYASPDDIPSYLQERVDSGREHREVVTVATASSFDDLMAQMGEHHLTPHESEVMTYLIGSLDDDGFLRKDAATLNDELAVYQGVSTTDDEVERLIGVLQTFEPRGIGARTLQECLRLQLFDDELRSPYKRQALEVVEEAFDDFAAKRWDEVVQRYGFSKEVADAVYHLLTHLNPRPAAALGNDATATAPTVTPDFHVTVGRDGQPVVELDSGEVPALRVSPAFYDSLRQYGEEKTPQSHARRDAYIYARQKVDAAERFISLLQRRRQTLMAVMQAIVDRQYDFFVNDDDDALLRPMTLREVAQRAGVDISTVSRAAASKYVQTDYGMYSLKYFFSLQFTSEAGDEVSVRQVKAALSELIAGEDKQHPYSDEQLSKLLQEKHLPVARRTVAKYREQMGLLTARWRREG